VSGRTEDLVKNLFAEIPDELQEELLETLVNTGAVQIQRIVSRGHTTPADDWYDQDTNEFVILLKGAARLGFRDGRSITLGPGDWLEIPAHQQHRVTWTDERVETVWLAVHYA
jgi:cupin 2 domain-containing protein